MATTSQKKLNEVLRNSYLSKISEFFKGLDEEILITGSNEISIPCLDSEGNDKFIQIVVKVPTGSRDGEEFDGYGLAQEYSMHLTEKAEKARIAEKKKAEKIARDKASREVRARAREKVKARVEGK